MRKLRPTFRTGVRVWPCVALLILAGCSKPAVPTPPQDVPKRVNALLEGANAKVRGRQSVSFELKKSRELLESHTDDPSVIAMTAYLLSVEAGVQFRQDKADEAQSMLNEAVELLDDAGSKLTEPLRELKEAGAIVYADAALLAGRSGETDRCMELFSKVDPADLDLRILMFSKHLNSVRDHEDFKQLLASVEKPLLNFDPSFRMQDHAGKDVSLNDFVGKVVVINIWGTWCPPCRREMPHFIEMQKEHGDDLQFVGLTYEQGAPPDVVSRILGEFIAGNSVNYPLLIGTKAYADKIPKLAEFPTTFILDRKGKLRKRVNGGLQLDELKSLLEPLLAE